MSTKLIKCSKKKCLKEEKIFNIEKQKLVDKNNKIAMSKESNIVSKMRENKNIFINSEANKSINNCHANKCQNDTKEVIKEYLMYVKQGCDAKSKSMCDLLKTYGTLLNKDKITGDDKRILEKKYIQALFS